MPLASWIVATHFRPALLTIALEALRESEVPAGWEVEIVVAHHADDHAAAGVAAAHRAIVVPTTKANGGPKRNAALAASRGELILVADDDDIHSPNRLAAAVAAHEDGYAVTGCKEFRYLHVRRNPRDELVDGMVVRWNGAGGLATDRPPVYVGTARNFRRSVIACVGGWGDLPNLIEKDLQFRLVQRYPPKVHTELDLTRTHRHLANETVCIQHDANVWRDRPALRWGQWVYRGEFLLTGEGHINLLDDLGSVQGYLRRL